MKQIIFLLIFAGVQTMYSQTIQSVGNTFTVQYDDLEKAIKSSAGMIKSKKPSEWTTLGDKWVVQYQGSEYTITVNGKRVYSSTQIVAIRAYYIQYYLETKQIS